MSDWWRRNKRLEEAGEVAPSGFRAGLFEPQTEEPTMTLEQQSADLKRRLLEVETKLGNINVTDGRGRRIHAEDWNSSRQRLKQEKTRILVEYAKVKAALAEERRQNNPDNGGVISRAKFERALGLIASLRLVVASIEEPTAQDNELVRTAGGFLRDNGALV